MSAVARTARILTGPLLVAALCAACVTGSDGSTVLAAADRIRPGVTRKEDVLHLLGPPTELRRQGEDTVLGFASVETNGTGYGFGVAGVGLEAESTHAGVDWLEIHIGPDRVVRSVRVVAMPKRTPIVP